MNRFTEFAEWTLGEFSDAVIGSPRLIQQTDEPTRVVSFGRFASPEAA
jgi:hypothetical protein